uniref:Uncharacterized protein n=1 Tax=Arundo donax TaxID=35708 RepID=A0A0A9CJL1_ARUDO
MARSSSHTWSEPMFSSNWRDGKVGWNRKHIHINTSCSRPHKRSWKWWHENTRQKRRTWRMRNIWSHMLHWSWWQTKRTEWRRHDWHWNSHSLRIPSIWSPPSSRGSITFWPLLRKWRHHAGATTLICFGMISAFIIISTRY